MISRAAFLKFLGVSTIVISSTPLEALAPEKKKTRELPPPTPGEVLNSEAHLFFDDGSSFAFHSVPYVLRDGRGSAVVTYVADRDVCVTEVFFRVKTLGASCRYGGGHRDAFFLPAYLRKGDSLMLTLTLDIQI